MTTVLAEIENEPALRRRISELRQDLASTTLAYQMARKQRQSEEIGALLRKRTELTRLLFQAQGELLLLFRTETESLEQAPYNR
jgi:hypothetical protein